MSDFAIIIDSTADLPRSERDKYGLDYVPMGYILDGKEYTASLDWEYHSPSQYYDYMRDGGVIKTTQVSLETFSKKFREYLEKGQDIVYISCSSALSGSIHAGEKASEELKKEYPDRKIFCVDSLNASLGQGYLAIMASGLRNEGKTIEETVDHLIENRLKINQFATVDSLAFLKKAGRVTASSAFFGNLFGIKPIIISDAIGQNYACKKVKGAANAKAEIISMVRENAENIEKSTLYISHADAEDVAEEYREDIMDAMPFADSYISIIGPIVGATTGPGTIDVYVFGKKVTIEGKC